MTVQVILYVVPAVMVSPVKGVRKGLICEKHTEAKPRIRSDKVGSCLGVIILEHEMTRLNEWTLAAFDGRQALCQNGDGVRASGVFFHKWRAQISKGN